MGTILAILQAIGMVKNMFGSNGEMQENRPSLGVPVKFFNDGLADVGVRRNYQ